MSLLEIPQTPLLAIDGIKLYACDANIRYQGRKDLSLIELHEHASMAAIFTQNAFCAAPVQLAKEHLQKRQAGEKSYLLINAGNANAGTGKAGYQTALATCELVAKRFDVKATQVFPFSTGVIGQALDVSKFEQAIGKIASHDLQAESWSDVAQAILTTDTCIKAKSLEIEIDGKPVRLTGIAKGSGMIKPNMATLLAYIATDARIEQALLERLLKESAEQSFNCISIDGDTSTNDALVLMATGSSQLEITKDSLALEQFRAALHELSIFLAQVIVKDGEGATKFIEIRVQGGNSREECKEVAYTIAHSPLVKTAFFASDPNWGRILAALGRAPLDKLDIGKVDIYLGKTLLVKSGELAESYTETLGQEEMNKAEITVTINLHRGDSEAKVWTCDFSYDYVKINAEYRS